MAPKFAFWFLTGQQEDAAELPGSDEPDSACRRPPDTPSEDVFCCRGRSPDSQVAVVPTPSRCEAASVTNGLGTTHCLQLRGQCRIFAPQTRFTGFPFKPPDIAIWWTVTP